jgi:hypothetical protein
MTLPASGNSISFSQIRDEFGASGANNSVSLGAYRISQSVGTLSNLPLDTGVPQSGTIKSSDLYGKKLNIVVDCHSGSAETRVDARTKYDANQITIIGGFKTEAQKPSAGAGSRIIANVNKLIGSVKTGRNYAALKTGQWGSGATMEIVIGSSGGIYGAGGDGGRGGDGDGSSGGQGTSALAIQYPVAINNQGTIFAGRGGGGGGAGGRGYKHADTQRGRCRGRQDCSFVAGGGGAGGRGYPGGTGGVRGNNPGSCRGVSRQPGDGTDGSLTSNGTGGTYGHTNENGGCDQWAISGSGGSIESSGDGGSGVPSGGYGPGSGGSRGYAVIIDSTGSLISYTGNARDGDTFTSAQVGSSL